MKKVTKAALRAYLEQNKDRKFERRAARMCPIACFYQDANPDEKDIEVYGSLSFCAKREGHQTIEEADWVGRFVCKVDLLYSRSTITGGEALAILETL